MSYQLGTAKVWDGAAWVPALGGASSPAVVSGTTGSPTITTDGSATIYKFTGDGSITLSQGGLCDYLVVGGGGYTGNGGGSTYETGGGAGGLLQSSNFYLPAGTHTIEVGAGGVLARNSGIGGSSRILDIMGIHGGQGFKTSGQFENNGNQGGSGSGACGTNAVSSPASYGVALGIAGQGYAGYAKSGGGDAAGGGAGGPATDQNSPGPGVASSITGSSVTYARGGSTATANTANSGNGGGSNSNGNSGVVILRIG